MDKSLTFFNTYELIQIGMNFQAYVVTDIDTHQGKLQMVSCP
ncbi:hypothetical protein HM1_2477 [Heliomicrobium modesticaldum Ice1]|uniref:Uncharacterized protein n=1 Tax=Heliobacterium modesticaldum (strain ATCC 51547 / Ice1) TaxID=498761 RepID=B0TAH7_HELMI|nr:hypothetical protein HM1_2477 [Heliomicrobium modesticaldum Ice1]